VNAAAGRSPALGRMFNSGLPDSERPVIQTGPSRPHASPRLLLWSPLSGPRYRPAVNGPNVMCHRPPVHRYHAGSVVTALAGLPTCQRRKIYIRLYVRLAPPLNIAHPLQDPRSYGLRGLQTTLKRR